jgi:hypothetical protein
MAVIPQFTGLHLIFHRAHWFRTVVEIEQSMHFAQLNNMLAFEIFVKPKIRKKLCELTIAFGFVSRYFIASFATGTLVPCIIRVSDRLPDACTATTRILITRVILNFTVIT